MRTRSAFSLPLATWALLSRAPAPASAGESACVTGAAGFVALELVAQLLGDGFEVHGTVRSKENLDAVTPLLDVAREANATDRLVLHQADLLDEGSFDACVAGRDYVFHTAAVFDLAVDDDDIESQLVKPALDGTRNVLRAVQRAPSVKRTVLTATFCSVWSFCGSAAWQCPNEQRPKNGEYFDEEDWATTLYPDGGLAYKAGQAYCRSKVEQDKAAREFADLHGLDLVTVHPSLMAGPPRGPRDSGVSMQIMKAVAGGTFIPQVFPSCDVRDVAAAHAAVATTPGARGRYVVSAARIPTDREFWTCLKGAHPGLELGPEPAATESHWMRASSKKVEELLGRPLVDNCKTWTDAVGAIIKKGYARNDGTSKDEL